MRASVLSPGRPWGLLWVIGVLSACGGEPEPPCGAEAPGEVCLARGLAMLTAGDARRADALSLLDDACTRLRVGDACAEAGRAWLGGKAVPTLPEGEATGEGSPFGRGIRYLRAACDLGEGDVCWDLGRRSMRGVGIPRSPEQAAGYFASGCEAGHLESCVDRGIFYETGRVGASDPVRARALFEQACSGEHARGCTKLGLALRDGVGGPSDGAAGVAALEQGCALGFAAGCGLAAISWDQGLGVPVTETRRIEMLVAGAALTDRVAYEHLVTLHGEDRLSAEAWTELAQRLDDRCESDVADACLMAGEVADLRGDLDDAERAARWRRACSLGANLGCGYLHRLIGEGRAAFAPSDTRLLLPERGCEAGLADVCFDLGEGFEQGRYEDVDLDAASRAYARACQSGMAEGCLAKQRLDGRLDAP